MKDTLRLIQLSHPVAGRKIALVQEPSLILLSRITSVYDLALEVIKDRLNIETAIQNGLSTERLHYDDVYTGKTEWTILPSFDCPHNPFGCLVSGTGLTHKNSALNRQMMHGADENTLTDSMKMYQWGLEGGQPGEAEVGVQPEWFYKGTGQLLKAHRQSLPIPAFADDGGEEPEIAGVYIVDRQGQPYRIGFTTGNEFSDHVMEKKNYLYLAPSKLRSCAIGPELVIDASFSELHGTVSIRRGENIVWSAGIKTGEKNMAHSLANLEYHHFKYEQHRVPLQAHVHFFGADAFSFGAGIKLENGDEMIVGWQGMGRPLCNPVVKDEEVENFVSVKPLQSLGL